MILVGVRVAIAPGAKRVPCSITSRHAKKLPLQGSKWHDVTQNQSLPLNNTPQSQLPFDNNGATEINQLPGAGGSHLTEISQAIRIRVTGTMRQRWVELGRPLARPGPAPWAVPVTAVPLWSLGVPNP